MPRILRNLPFFDADSRVEVRERSYRVLPRQIVVWVSLSPKGLKELDRRSPRFPAILDNAFTDGFLIHEEQLRRFAGLDPRYLPRRRDMHPHGRTVPLHAANVWLHPSKPGRRDEFSGSSPLLLELPRGAGVCSDPDGYPRLPLLGSWALRQAGLLVCTDYARLHVNARTPRRFWPFG